MPSDLARVVGADDLMVIQLADRLHLAFESRDGMRVVGPGSGEQLQCHYTIELGVQGLEDGAHAAVAQLFDQYVFAERRSAHRPKRSIVLNRGTGPARREPGRLPRGTRIHQGMARRQSDIAIAR